MPLHGSIIMPFVWMCCHCLQTAKCLTRATPASNNAHRTLREGKHCWRYLHLPGLLQLHDIVSHLGSSIFQGNSYNFPANWILLHTAPIYLLNLILVCLLSARCLLLSFTKLIVLPHLSLDELLVVYIL